MKKYILLYLFLLVIIFMFGCDKEKSDTTVLGSGTSLKNLTGKGKLIARKGKAREQSHTSLDGIKRFPDIEAIIDRGTLNIAVYDCDCAPFVMKSANGELYGLDVDVAQGIAESIGVKPNFVSLESIHEVLKKLCGGEFDIAVGQISSSIDRSEHMFFSSTYVHLKQALIICKKDLIAPDIEKDPYKYMKDHPCRIGAVEGWVCVEFALHHFPQAEVIVYPTEQDALEALNKHEIMAIMDDSNTLILLALKHPELALSATMYVLENKKDNVAVAVSPACPNLLNSINLYLENQGIYLDLNDLVLKYPEVYR